MSNLRYIRLVWLSSSSFLGLTCLIDPYCIGLRCLPNPSSLSVACLVDVRYIGLSWLLSPSTLSLVCLSYPRYLELIRLPSLSFLDLAWFPDPCYHELGWQLDWLPTLPYLIVLLTNFFWYLHQQSIDTHTDGLTDGNNPS